MNVQQRIKDLEDQLAELKKSLEVEEKAEWPQDGGRYYAINDDGSIDGVSWDGDEFDLGCQQIGNIFRTEEEAQAEVEARKVIAELRATEGRVEVFAASDVCYGLNVSGMVDIEDGTFDFFLAWESQDAANAAIDKVGEERIIAAAKHLGRL